MWNRSFPLAAVFDPEAFASAFLAASFFESGLGLAASRGEIAGAGAAGAAAPARRDRAARGAADRLGWGDAHPTATEADPATEANARSPSAGPSVRRRRRMKTNSRNRPPSVVTISASAGAGDPPPSSPGVPFEPPTPPDPPSLPRPSVVPPITAAIGRLAGRGVWGDGRGARRGGRLVGRGRPPQP